MSKILVFGHQNPDSDAIGSSVAFAYLAKEAYGLDTEAVALGTPNEETAFVLNYFGVEAPRVITSAKAEGAEQVILTDHNEFQQSVSDIAEVTIVWLTSKLLAHFTCVWSQLVQRLQSFTVCSKNMV